MNIGAPLFRGQCKSVRSSGYTFVRGIAEFIDNIILKCKQIAVVIDLNPSPDYPSSVSISDDYKNGFVDINKVGEENPFNMTHMRTGHSDDDETSEFGIGMKSASINLGEVFTVYTRLEDGNCYVISFDYRKMCLITEASKSYEATVFKKITFEEYSKFHKFETGSTIIIKHIRKEIVNFMDYDTRLILNDLSRIYDRICKMRNTQFTVNGLDIVEQYEPLKDPKCITYNIQTRVYYYTNNDTIVVELQKKVPWSTSKKQNNKCLLFWDGSAYIKGTTSDNIRTHMLENKKYRVLLLFTSTFTMFNGKERYYPRGCIAAYRASRCYADVTATSLLDDNISPNISKLDYRQRAGNNSQIQSYHEISWQKKCLNSKIGLTFNKHLNADVTTGLTKLLATIQKDHEYHYSADRSTGKYDILHKHAINEGIVSVPVPRPRPRPVRREPTPPTPPTPTPVRVTPPTPPTPTPTPVRVTPPTLSFEEQLKKFTDDFDDLLRSVPAGALKIKFTDYVTDQCN
jgi:hypothetical protein